MTSWPDDPRAPAGGVEAVSVNLLEPLAKFRDLDLHVVTTKRTYSSLRTRRWGNVNIHRLPWAGGSTLGHAIGPGRRQMQKYIETIEPDIVHAHDTYGLMVKGMVLPRVFTIHGFIYRDTAVSGSRFARVRSWIWRQIETSGWADQPHIISISPYVRRHLESIAKGAIYDIDNPAAESFFDVKRTERRGVIFSAACISRLKNTLGLLQAMARLSSEGCEATLRLAGSCHDLGYEHCLKEFIRDHDLMDRVAFLGSLTVEQIQAELASASVFALVSLHENAPLSIVEAMAAGVPVVTSNRCGMPYMVRDGESGFLVDPEDPDDIARRLGQVLENDALRRSMGAKGREIALDRFHPLKVAARTREVYLRVVNGFRQR